VPFGPCPIFIPEPLLCGSQELHRVVGHAHLVLTCSAALAARLLGVGALRKGHVNPGLLYRISVAGLLDRACRMPMFRSKSGSDVPPVLPRPSSRADRRVEACDIESINSAVDREPRPFWSTAGCSRILAKIWHFEGKQVELIKKGLCRPPKSGKSRRCCLGCNGRCGLIDSLVTPAPRGNCAVLCEYPVPRARHDWKHQLVFHFWSIFGPAR
jgi:hypothetical protein